MTAQNFHQTHYENTRRKSIISHQKPNVVEKSRRGLVLHLGEVLLLRSVSPVVSRRHRNAPAVAGSARYFLR